MARIRTIKPDFFTSLTIAALSHSERLTFIGLWTCVDDFGIARDEPRLLKAAIWPLDDDMTATLLDLDLKSLADHNLILRYTADGKRYIAVRNWLEHQRIAHPTPSTFPPPPEILGEFREASRNIREEPREIREDSRKVRGGKERKGRERKRKGKEKDGDDDSGKLSDGLTKNSERGDLIFEQAWGDYPKRPNNSKAKALRAWHARVTEGAEPNVMLDCTRSYAAWCAHEKIEPRFVKMASTFYGPDRHYLNDFTIEDASSNGSELEPLQYVDRKRRSEDAHA